jgi:hypothetical protein
MSEHEMSLETKEARAAKLLTDYIIEVARQQKDREIQLTEELNKIASVDELDLVELSRMMHDLIEAAPGDLTSIKPALHPSVDVYVQFLLKALSRKET